MLKTGAWVKVYDIPAVMSNEEAGKAVDFFFKWIRMGFPYGPWGENPNPLVEIVDLLDPLERFYNPPMRI